MKFYDIRKHIQDFFRGNDSERGRRIIDAWYHFFDERPNELKEMNIEEKEALRKSLFRDVRRKAGIPGKHLHMHGDRRGTGSSKKTWGYKLAAGFAVLFLAMIPVFLFTSEEPNPVPAAYKTSSNPAGQSSQITLADGSTVWLSAKSTLRYPEKFAENIREVTLQGEAFFEISGNPDKPFSVLSKGLETRVLGTSFNIRAFENEKDIEITVTTGRVSVGRTLTQEDDSAKTNNKPVAILAPDQQLVYNSVTQKSVTQSVDSNLYTSWKDGQLIFENHTFAEIARRLERWYGVQFHFADEEVKQSRFRITFENTSLQHAMNMLQVIEDFEFEIEEDQIWIR